MTTNQTIDGVPRDLLERLHAEHVSIAGPGFWAAWKELRALLDANPEENVPCPQCGGSLRTWGCNCTPRWPMHKESTAPNTEPAPCAKSQIEPAAQPKGEPVAYLVEAYDDIAVRRSIVSKVRFDDGNREMREWAKPWLVRETPLYAEQPAPVAVVLPEREEALNVLGSQFDDGRCAGWNACLDEVIQLNTKE